MQCNIKHIEKNQGLDYWCLTHKTKATKADLSAPISCDCKYKYLYENIVEMTPNEIETIKIIYPNLNNNTDIKVFINNQEFNGILKLEDSVIDLKDYGGLMLSKLNNISLETSKCPYCGGTHTDNGKFAYKPHSKHLCVYCGHFYNVEKKNIGNELALYFKIPNIKLENNISKIDEKCEVSYDFLKGILNINNVSCNKVLLNNKEIDIVTFLNNVLKDEY